MIYPQIHKLLTDLNLTDHQLSLIANSYPVDHTSSPFEESLHCAVIAELDHRSKQRYQENERL